MDTAILRQWLLRTKCGIRKLCQCFVNDRFVRFTHFWISRYPDNQKRNFLTMQHDSIEDEVKVAFQQAFDDKLVNMTDVHRIMKMVLPEYPTKLLAKKSPLFLKHLEALLLSRDTLCNDLVLTFDIEVGGSVECKNRLDITRGFTLVSMWTAVTDMYIRSSPSAGSVPSSPTSTDGAASSQDSVHIERAFQAATLGYPDALDYVLVTKKLPVTCCNSHCQTLLMTAAISGQPEIVKYLFAKHKERMDSRYVNQQCARSGNTALHEASLKGSVEIVRSLLNSKLANVNACNEQDSGATALHYGIMQGSTDLIKLLLSNGADANLKMSNMTAQEMAAVRKQKDIISLLKKSK